MKMPVKRILQQLIRGIIINVITAGDLIQPYNADTIPRYDGSISSLVTISWFVGIVFVTMFVAVTLQFQNIKDFISISIFILRVLGVIAMISFSISMCRNRRRRENLILSTAVRIKVKFLWFFGMLYTTMILDKIIVYVACLLDNDSSKVIGIQLFFRITDLAWIFLLTVFMTHFVCKQYKNTLLLQWGITTIIIAVMMSWCYTFLDHTFVQLSINIHNRTEYLIHNHIFNQEFYSSFQDQNCNESLALNRFFKAIKSPISSAAAEFYLMVFILLLEVISKSKAEYKLETCAQLRIQMSDDLANKEIENIAPVEEPNESSPLITSQMEPTSRHNNNKSVAKTISLLTAGVTSIPQIIGTLLPYFTIPGSQSYLLWYGYQLFYSIVMLICCFIVFCKLNHSCRPDQNRKRKKGYVLIVCSAFDTGLRAFNLIAAIFLLSKTPKIAAIAIVIPLNKIIINFLQTIFILHAQKFRKIKSSGILPLETVCLILMIMNFGLWFVDNFGKYSYDQYDVGGFYIAKNFYGLHYWHYIAIVILPVSMFYRLHSGIDLYEIYLDFKRM